MKCPKCQDGYLFGFACPGFKPTKLACPICKGSGVLPGQYTYDPERGERMRQKRIDGQITMREMHKIDGILPSDRSRMEQGFFLSEELKEETG